MRYLKLFKSFEDIDKICKRFNVTNYTINSDGSIDAYGVIISDWYLKKLPLKFNMAEYFDCSNNELVSLEGSPVQVNGSFYCNSNKLTSFEFAPKIIRGNFNCRNNNIKTFEYFPNYVKDYLICVSNPIFVIWELFQDTTKIELLNDFDIFRDEDTDKPAIVMDRLNDFLLTIGKCTVEKVNRYKNI